MGSVVVGQFTIALAAILGGLLNFYFCVVIISALISWVNPDPRNPIVRFLRAVTEPALHQIRRRLPFVFAGGIDFSPLVLILAIQFVQIFLVGSLEALGYQIRYGKLGVG